MTTDDGGEVFEFGYRNGRQFENYLVDVTAEGRENLARVLAIVFTSTMGGDLGTGYYHITPNRQLTFFGGQPRPDEFEGAVAFPEPLVAGGATSFAWDWLQQVTYPRDEHDGAVHKGWRVLNERYGIVANCWQAIVAVRPMWIYIPK